MLEISEFRLLLEESVTYKDKGSSSCLGRGGYGTSPTRKTLLWKLLIKHGQVLWFRRLCLSWLCSEVQISSRRMSRPALRSSCFFPLSAFLKYHPPEKTWSSLYVPTPSSRLGSCVVGWRLGREKRGNLWLRSFPKSSLFKLPRTEKDFSTALIWEGSCCCCFFSPICPFFIKQPNLPCLG